eukprot:TRINITY_DN33397_c0_g1_i1.p1 TRINITY_DN33397_c0_g1~~TRINITY_DN33397_c0_g1_i1.p1  ORF type:complete len:1120 (-),score=168.36 TRINITY_DN33397_c0_g1_i1:50-3409(-)
MASLVSSYFFANVFEKQFEKRLGYFAEVAPENLSFNITNGVIKVEKAHLKPENFDELHLPFTIRGGSCDVIRISLVDCAIVVENVFFAFSPHTTDWTWEHVSSCKAKLVDMAMHMNELRKPKKRQGKKGGFMSSMKDQLFDKMKDQLLDIFQEHLKVNVRNIHFRYEDRSTQRSPFAGGFKIGYIGVPATESGNCGVTGDWKQSSGVWAEPAFQLSVMATRISAYWDLNLKDDQLVSSWKSKPLEVRKMFSALTVRERFSAMVVEAMLSRLSPEQRQGKSWKGIGLRENFDFHRYLLFPVYTRGCILVNRKCQNTLQQRAPLGDVGFVFDSIEVAVDSEQVRSMNELLAWRKDFQEKDCLMRSRPKERIAAYPRCANAKQLDDDPSSERVSPKYVVEYETDEKRKLIVKQWWWHALRGVRIMCNMPTSHINKDELNEKLKLREEYVLATMDFLDAMAAQSQGQTEIKLSRSGLSAISVTTARDRLRDMQMSFSLWEILEWRILARDRLAEDNAEEDMFAEKTEFARSSGGEVIEETSSQPERRPRTLQVCVSTPAVKAFFLIVVEAPWSNVVREARDVEGQPSTHPRRASQKVPRPATDSSNSKIPYRELAVTAQFMTLHVAAVQKGTEKRCIGRWIEFGIGSLSVSNFAAVKASREVLKVAPFEHSPGKELCVFMSVTTFQAHDHSTTSFDPSLDQMLEPSLGISGHLEVLCITKEESIFHKLDCLERFKNEPGRFWMFGFVRVGQVRGLCYAPFVSRLLYFLKRGRRIQPQEMTLRRTPSKVAIEKELMRKLQMRVQAMTGKSYQSGFFEGTLDGLRVRHVDHYNSTNVLCKEAALAPVFMKLVRNGSPQTVQIQIRERTTKRDLSTLSRIPAAVQFGGGAGLLPWKVSTMLLPKADFDICIENCIDKDENGACSEEQNRSQSGRPSPRGVVDESTVNTSKLVPATYFQKWCRNGKSKRRFIEYNDEFDAITWKAKQEDQKPLGVISLSNVQDVCEGVRTPVLLKAHTAHNGRLRTEHFFSVVATERTLDLQAETSVQRDEWVAFLKQRFKKHVMQCDGDWSSKVPKELENLVRNRSRYPVNFRSPLCHLRSTYRKIQGVLALDEIMSPTASAGRVQ